MGKRQEIALNKSEIQELVEFAQRTVNQDWPHPHPTISVQVRLQHAAHLDDAKNEQVAQIYLATLRGEKSIQNAVDELDQMLNGNQG